MDSGLRASGHPCRQLAAQRADGPVVIPDHHQSCLADLTVFVYDGRLQ
jgi:hypothetical protein